MKVRAVCDVYINSTYREAGTVFDYHGEPDPHLVPVAAEEVGLQIVPAPAVATTPVAAMRQLPNLEELRKAAAAGEAQQTPPADVGVTSVRLPVTGAEDGADLLK